MDHYEYLAVITDNLLLFTNNPADILEPLKKVLGCKLKVVGTPEYYNGRDVGYNKEKGKWFFGANNFIKNATEKIKKLMEVKLKNYGSSMDTGDHTEVYDADMMFETDITMHTATV